MGRRIAALDPALCDPRGTVQGRDTSIRSIIYKGRFVQGAHHPRTFGRGHISRGHINPASGGGQRDGRTEGRLDRGTGGQRDG
jgi:hypothetical protein